MPAPARERLKREYMRLRRRKRWVMSRARNRVGRAQVLARLPRGGVGVEVGTWHGDFAAHILRWTRPAQLFLVDPWRHAAGQGGYEHAMFSRAGSGQADMDRVHEGVLNRFADEINAKRVVVLRELSIEAAKRWDEETLDWVYLDGDHTYEAVRADLEAYWRLVKRGGFVAGDDYGFPGWWDDGVTRAVDEFTDTHGLDVAIMGAQFLLRKPSA
jgi:Methyltransferase domain